MGGLALGILTTLTAIVICARIVENLRQGSSIITGSRTVQEPYPFVIKDDAKEASIELEHLGYKPMENFDVVDGLGR